jgi:cytochrome c biogenesis protein CcmG/thiol:disulfide interchange protein DsbE
VLLTLKTQGIPLFGIAYKDKQDATADFLGRYGNPYARIGRDEPGRTAIDFGVYGVPETYLVDAGGIVRWRWAGALTADVVRDTLMPMIKAAS